MNNKKVLLALTTLFSSCCWSAFALTTQENTPWQAHLDERIHGDFVPYKPLQPDQEITVSGLIADDAKIYNVKITVPSGDKQLDFDCLQAVMGASSYHPRMDTDGGALMELSWSFDSKLVHPDRYGSIGKYFEKHPDQRNKCLAFYRIPLDVLVRYPGLFTEKELLDASNIETLKFVFPSDHPESRPKDVLAVFYGGWVHFFETHPHATRDEITRAIPNIIRKSSAD